MLFLHQEVHKADPAVRVCTSQRPEEAGLGPVSWLWLFKPPVEIGRSVEENASTSLTKVTHR